VQRTIEEWGEALALLDDKIDFYGQWMSSGKRPALEPSTPTARKTRTP
jgi:hypothetical protein